VLVAVSEDAGVVEAVLVVVVSLVAIGVDVAVSGAGAVMGGTVKASDGAEVGLPAGSPTSCALPHAPA